MSFFVVCAKVSLRVANRDDMVSPIKPISEEILEVMDRSRRWRSLLKTGDNVGIALISAMVASVARAMAVISRAVDDEVEAASSPDPKKRVSTILPETVVSASSCPRCSN